MNVMERKILLLGLLRQHEMHGYQLNELIEAHFGTSWQLTKPTAYRLLQKMTEDGWITFQAIQEGKRPTKRIYSITPQGEQEFQNLLRKSLAHYEPIENRNLISLVFVDALPLDEVLSLLESRGKMLAKVLKSTQTSVEKHEHGHFGLLLENQIRHLSLELEWLKEVVNHLKAAQQTEIDEKKGTEM